MHFLEVLLGQTVHQNQRAAMNLHGSARTEMVKYTLGHDRSGLTADGVIIETGPAGALLAFGDDAGGAAVQSVSIAADSAALRSIVVERIVNVAVDEARADNLAVDVDNSLDAGLVNFVFKADLRNLAVTHDDGIAGDDALVDIATDDFVNGFNDKIVHSQVISILKTVLTECLCAATADYLTRVYHIRCTSYK